MNIAIIGYGKMGKEVEKLANEKGYKISLIIDIDNLSDLTPENLGKSDVAIEFTTPQTAAENILKCFDAGIPVVTGTTGWLDRFGEIKRICLEKKQALFYAPNFSPGVNILFELNRRLAGIMKNFSGYDVNIEETHHTQKLDSPSGTAVALADEIIENIPGKKSWANKLSEDPEILNIISYREGNIPGIHTITWDSDIDTVQIRHSAKNRKGLALGTMLAAEFIIGKKGVFGMKDLLKF